MAIVGNAGVTKINTAEVTYSWQIENFMLNGKRIGEFISSPVFSTGPCEDISWILHAYPKGIPKGGIIFVNETCIAISLQLFKNNRRLTIEAEIEFSVTNSKNQRICEKFIYLFDQKYTTVIREMANLRINDLPNFLINNNLTITCSIRAGVDVLCLPLTNKLPPSDFNTEKESPKLDSNIQQLTEDLGKLMESQRFGDVTLVASGEKIQAHRAILSARSSVFLALFSHDMKENKEKLITIKDVEPDVLKEMLRFIYTGKVENLDSLACELLSLSDKYALDGLKMLCEDFLCNSITIDNAIDILVLSDFHLADTLKTEVINFVKPHASLVINSDKYRTLEKTNAQLAMELLRSLALK